ncbi:hypothetical protein GT002_12450, partial [Streptomyces sp. SID4917]
GAPAGDGAGSAAPSGSPKPAPSGGVSTASPKPAAAEASSSPTPPWALGAVRYVVLIVLITGIAAAIGGPLLPRLAPVVAAGWRSLRREDDTT